jgi:hypothetical protein
MARKAGDRYACSECGSTLVYEKDCACSCGLHHQNAPIPIAAANPQQYSAAQHSRRTSRAL